MKTTILALAVASAGLLWGDAARAVDAFNVDVDVYNTSGPEFIAGDGIPINGFTQDTVTPNPLVNTISVALKPRDRDTGQANAIVGNRYFVDAGFSSTNPAVTNLSIDFQFDPGVSLADNVDNDLDSDVDEPDETSLNYILRQSVDFDPAVGATDFAVITLPIFDADGVPDATVDSWIDTDGFFTTNGGGGAWNDQTVPYVISNSTRQDFAFWSSLFGKSYDPNAVGEYEYRLEALDPSGSVVLADAVAFAQIVPEPATLGLLGVAAVCSLAVARRRRFERS